MTLFISAFAVTTGNTMTNDITKPKEEVLIERKCNICGKLAKMSRFDRYCSPNCRSTATKLDNTNHGIRFR